MRRHSDPRLNHADAGSEGSTWTCRMCQAGQGQFVTVTIMQATGGQRVAQRGLARWV